MINSKISPNLKKCVKTLGIDRIDVIAYVKKRNVYGALQRYNIVREYPFIGAVGLSLSSADLEPLSYIPLVEYLTKSSDVFTLKDPLPYANDIEGFSYSGNLTGKGVGLCVLDTGVSPHLDFCIPVNRIIDFVDFVGGMETPYDDNGHGTFVTGVAAGGGISSGLRLKGVAPKCDIISVKVIGDGGEGGAFNVLDGMQWALDNRKKHNIRVCCMSFGSTPTDVNDPLKRGAEVLVANGIAVVAASGNSGVNNLKSPAISLDVISVGAVNGEDMVADFTSRGYVGGRQKPELYADGVNVVSTVRNAAYGRMSGTSTAAPYIAGASCLLLQKYPSATPRQIRDMLLMSSKLNKTGQYILRLN